MKKDGLIVTNTFLYKISNFFRKIFSRDKKYKEHVVASSDNACYTQIKYEQDNQLEEINRKNILAEKLMLGEIDINMLSDIEVVEMVEYFDRYVNEMNFKLEYIRRNILKLRKENIEE